jgi:hypothetical protein
MRTISGFLLAMVMVGLHPAWAGGLPPDAEIERLWQQSRMNGATAQTASNGAHEQAVERIRRAAELSMQYEAGLLELSGSAFEKLEQILSTPPVKERPLRSARGPASTGTLQGTVTEDGHPAVFPQGQVRAIPFGTDFFSVYSASIQPDGSYSLIIPPGRYVLQTNNHPEHVREAWPDTTCVNAQLCSPFYGGQVLEVTDGSVSTHDFQLARGVRVTGTVSDSMAAPVPSVSVRVISRNRNVQTSGFTDGAGVFTTAAALPPGDYRVIASPSSSPGLLEELHDGQHCQGFECQQLPVAFLSLSDTNLPTTVDFTLDAGSGLSGIVYESDGSTPLAGAYVELVSDDGLYQRTSLETDATGFYEFGPLRSTDYRIVVRHPERLGRIYPGIDCFGLSCTPAVGAAVSLGAVGQVLDFSLMPGNSVSGTVRRQSDGTPVEGASVSVFNTLQGSVFATTDAAGNYTVNGVTEGIFFVQVLPNQALTPGLQRGYLGNVNCPASRCGDFGTPVTVEAGDALVGVDVDLAPGGGLSGTVTDALTTEILGFGFVPRLELWVASGPYAGELAGQGLSDEFGNYTLNGLMPGSYKATFGTSTHLGLIDTAFGGASCPRGACDQSLLPTVFVTAGTVLPGISATLPRGPVISGTVTDALSGLAPDILAEGRGNIIAFYGTSGNYASFSGMDGEGLYRSRTGFPAGTFFVSTFATRNFLTFGDNYIDQVYSGLDCPRLQCSVTGAGTGLTVAATDVTGVDFSLRQGGRIEGRVRDVGTTDDLAGVVVEVYDGLARQVDFATTDVQGRYILEGLPNGNYYVRTRNLLGYQDQLHAGEPCNPFCDPVNGTPISVTEGSTVTAIDFDLVRSAALSGTVSLSGAPLANVTVEVYGAIGNLLGSTLSAADGSFEFNSLAAGEFYLRTRNVFGHADVLFNGEPCVGDACQVRRGDAIVLASGTSVSGLTLDLAPGATILGEVHDRLSPATQLSGVRVQLLDDRGAVAFETTSSATGQFSFGALAAGNYHLVTRETPTYVDQTFGGTPCPSACNGLNGTIISIAAGAVSSGNDLDLAPGASISGNVLASGLPSIGAIAQVYNDSGVPVSQGPTNPSGNYEVNELPDGDFFVRITNVPGHVSQLWDGNNCSGYCDILNGDPVSIVGSAPVGSVNFNLPAGGAISGQVTDGTTALPAVDVLAFDLSGFLAGRGVTDASGNYIIGGLENGSYKVRTVNAGGFVDEVFGGSSCSPSPCVLSGGSSVNVAGATTSGIDLALGAGGSISGTATDQFGNPLISGTARLLDQNGIELDGFAITEGVWTFVGLAAGTYFLLIENDLGLIDELYAGVPCPAGACDVPALGTPIVLVGSRLVRDASAGINLELSRGASISGRVTDQASGDPIVGARVFVRNPMGQLVASGIADGLGDYRIGASLPDGDYYVSTASGQQRGVGDNYINELYPDVPCALDCDLSQGNLITISGSDVAAVDFDLARGAGVSGRILQLGAGPLEQVEVRFFDSAGRLAGIRRSDSQGRYLLDGLPAGSYFAHTVNVFGLQDVTLGDAPCDASCEPLSGQSVTVPVSGVALEIDFNLDVRDEVFADRFE